MGSLGTGVDRQTWPMPTTTSPHKPALPLRTGPVRFMVVAADGKSSNSWRFWTEGAGDAYVVCRDNFKEGKISLHASGRWRIAWDEKAVAKNPRSSRQETIGSGRSGIRRRP